MWVGWYVWGAFGRNWLSLESKCVGGYGVGVSE
jgi:hypothetical protein